MEAERVVTLPAGSVHVGQSTPADRPPVGVQPGRWIVPLHPGRRSADGCCAEQALRPSGCGKVGQAQPLE